MGDIKTDPECTDRFVNCCWSDGANDGSLCIAPKGILQNSGQLGVSERNMQVTATNTK